MAHLIAGESFVGHVCNPTSGAPGVAGSGDEGQTERPPLLSQQETKTKIICFLNRGGLNRGGLSELSKLTKPAPEHAERHLYTLSILLGGAIWVRECIFFHTDRGAAPGVGWN